MWFFLLLRPFLLLTPVLTRVRGKLDQHVTVSSSYSEVGFDKNDTHYPASESIGYPFNYGQGERRSSSLPGEPNLPPGPYDGTESPPLLPSYDNDSTETQALSESSEASEQSSIIRDESGSLPLHSPVVYRYYGRSRFYRSGSVPFILLGPNVDHWKDAGQMLAARGFSVMACERVAVTKDGDSDQKAALSPPRHDEGAYLILELLDALRWNKVVLVGCDRESILAIQAAMRLAPDRVVGLVLCGNLDSTARECMADMDPYSRRLSGDLAVERFLRDRLNCPFTIVWDSGDHGHLPPGLMGPAMSEGSSSERGLGKHRSVILGGGSAPHRRRPELFAWILTRFVEEQIVPSVTISDKRSFSGHAEQSDGEAAAKQPGDKFHLPFGLEEYFSAESMVVFGRVVATALFYGTVVQVAIYQFENIRSIWATVTSIPQSSAAAISAFFSNLGSLFYFFRGNRQAEELVIEDTEKVEDEDSDDENGETAEEDEQDRTYKPLFFLDPVIA